LLARHESWTLVDWRLPAVMAAMAIIISRLSSRLSSAAPQRLMKSSFAALLVTIAIFTLIETWWIA